MVTLENKRYEELIEMAAGYQVLKSYILHPDEYETEKDLIEGLKSFIQYKEEKLQ